MPDIIPVELPAVATDVLLLVQVPPVVASESVVAEPEQILAEPDIAAGKGFTVIGDVMKHPVLIV